MKKKIILIFSFLYIINQSFSEILPSQTINYGRNSVAAEDPLVSKKLENWQDLKFGFFMHWGTYSQWGTVESWSLCGEDMAFIKENRPIERYPDYEQYKKDYKNLQKTFNPLSFDPEKWVKAAKEAGMKYVVFTTKHHDGFCMFDTKETDYKITSLLCPFHIQPNADITKAVFNTFRGNGFMIGAYFSKPDWNSEYYWWPYFPTANRNANYNPLKYPERWKKFKDYTYNQIQELMTGYGNIDILWLDGGQVNPSTNHQDIDMPKIADMARKNQPGIIIVDRGQKGIYTNYATPEQEVPEAPLKLPWESCITMGDKWSYKPNDNYKSAKELIHLLVDIVAKGGNLLLNVGPQPNGELPAIALSRMHEIGEWMKVNSEAIYGTKPVEPYKEGQVAFTKKGNAVYAIYMVKNEGEGLPEKVTFSQFRPDKGSKVYLLGHRQACVLKTDENGSTTLMVPAKAIKMPPCKHAFVFKISL